MKGEPDPLVYFICTAFWGESDDSASDIEAILHPKTSDVSKDEDDFDDFFS